MKITALLSLTAACLVAGCDTITQEVRTKRTLTDGTVELHETISKISAKWDAKTAIERLRVTNGKTQTIGLSGLDQEVTSTNFPRNAAAAAELLKSLR